MAEEESEEVKLLNESITHWEKMKRWAKKQPEQGFPYFREMHLDIGEYWRGDHCPLCNKYLERLPTCRGCPIYMHDFHCNHPKSTWKKVNRSKTWKEWLNSADEMINMLYRLKEIYIKGVK
jgi:hypothetical protein